jgi:hypothetical protein
MAASDKARKRMGGRFQLDTFIPTGLLWTVSTRVKCTWTLPPVQLKLGCPLLAKNVLDSIAVSDQSSLVRALLQRDMFLLAVANEVFSTFTAVLKSAAKIVVSRRVLELSGLPHFLRDLSLWRKSPNEGDELLASAIRQKWQKALASSEKLQPLHSQGFPVWRGFRAIAFAEQVAFQSDQSSVVDSIAS